MSLFGGTAVDSSWGGVCVRPRNAMNEGAPRERVRETPPRRLAHRMQSNLSDPKPAGENVSKVRGSIRDESNQ